MSTKSTCFVAMPVSMPAGLLERYRGDRGHFRHVLEYLFFPAIKRVGLEPVSPVAEGSDLIHAEIVRNVEESTLVLCDMSTLNPNVFFEVGIRTALNKSICFVIDDLSGPVPFDTGIINHYVYTSEMAVWNLERQVSELSRHIEASLKRCHGENPLWKYFSLNAIARRTGGGDRAEAGSELLALQIESLGRKLDQLIGALPALDGPLATQQRHSLMISEIGREFRQRCERMDLTELRNFRSMLVDRLQRTRTRAEEASLYGQLALVDERLQALDASREDESTGSAPP